VSPKTARKPEVLGASPEDAAELSRQLLKVQEEERRRISRELHDETGQALMVLRFHLEMLAGDSPSEEAASKIKEALEVLDRTIEGLRRTIARLSPRVLEEFGLVAAIRRQAQMLATHTGIKPTLELPERLPPMDHDVEVALYRSVQEALHNVAKHSHASNFTVRLGVAGSKVSVQIEDNGAGFSPRTAHTRGFGLTGMRERAAALGGTMKIHAERGKGTQIQIVLPRGADGAREQEQPTARRFRRAS
jgi:two-component system, NarL family, sensor histidine kinase UhpB